jgi:hypothetical protein
MWLPKLIIDLFVAYWIAHIVGFLVGCAIILPIMFLF